MEDKNPQSSCAKTYSKVQLRLIWGLSSLCYTNQTWIFQSYCVLVQILFAFPRQSVSSLTWTLKRVTVDFIPITHKYIALGRDPWGLTITTYNVMYIGAHQYCYMTDMIDDPFWIYKLEPKWNKASKPNPAIQCVVALAQWHCSLKWNDPIHK